MFYGNYKFIVLILIIQKTYAGTTDDRSWIHDNDMTEFGIFCVVSICCVLFGGLMSGLTVGLLGIDELELEIKLTSGTLQEKVMARKILSVINNHHLLLVTLLLANSIAMEALPLFLDEIFNTEISLAISVTLVLAFGEVIPQAVCTGRDQIKIAGKMIPIIKLLIILLFPFSYPIAKLLDYLLKPEHTSIHLKQDDLKTFISLHESFNKGHDKENIGLEKFQISTIHKVIDLNRIKVKSFMLPYKNFNPIKLNTTLDQKAFDKILIGKYNSIPVYEDYKSNIIGVIKIHELFRIIKNDNIVTNDLVMREPEIFDYKMTLLTALKRLEAAQDNIGFVTNNFDGEKKIIGVVTKEIIMDHCLSSTNLSERSDITEISRALAESLEHVKPSKKKNLSAMHENLL
ncbi:hypothetical protein SteCoe_12467 [Stentor coeruleus]|uniref:CNNM transmembrane domain-containing protein n=1 Tax=Stentor coeruleus TaxID=5963 RepID=A0A1R2CAT0_9CILI|nr:hypothetical protein SteCoe_12467 [Stentor coeruleus]